MATARVPRCLDDLPQGWQDLRSATGDTALVKRQNATGGRSGRHLQSGPRRWTPVGWAVVGILLVSGAAAILVPRLPFKGRKLLGELRQIVREVVGDGVPGGSYPDIVHEIARKATERAAEFLGSMSEDQVWWVSQAVLHSETSLSKSDDMIRLR